jgi:hypothetical protein
VALFVLGSITFLMLGNEEGTCHKKPDFRKSGKKTVYNVFQIVKKSSNAVFLKQQFPILAYLNSVTMVSSSVNSLNDIIFVFDMCPFTFM